MTEPSVMLKRVYAPAEPADGYRVLVDGLWPRGVSKAKAAVDLWLKEIAPSPTLRTWFGHDPERWNEFVDRYSKELSEPVRAEALAHLKRLVRERSPITLVYACRDEQHNHARMLSQRII